ncbi:uncharacterized protein batf2 [Parambassis ranga]|uniref:Uncharacterized protein batf2 n=1 Tax=Parambassis ranga TaxID=210632 RepID=A0A6P7K859_9TELE|nr:uncharacterized protein LOC114451255 [Parambassis ranga]
MTVHPAGGETVNLQKGQSAAEGDGEMPLLFMDTGYQPSSPSSLSAEECHSQAAGSEREEEGKERRPRGVKRREKNRNAARKSRKKQTERADALHEELQSLEQSNSALHKEIAALKKDLHLYTTALEHHEPHCTLNASTPSTSSSLSVSTCPTRSRSPQTMNSSLTAFPAPSTSLDLQSLKKTKLSPVALASHAGSSAELFATSSSSMNFPYSVSCGTQLHSLFSKEPERTSKPTNVMPFYTSHVSNPAHCTTPLLQSAQDSIPETSSASRDAFFMKRPFLTASHNAGSPYSCLQAENTEDCLKNKKLPPPYQFKCGNISSSPCAFLPSPLQSLSVSPQLSSVPSFDPKPSYNQQGSSSLLSLLTVPSPLNVSHNTSSSFEGSLCQFPPPPLPPVGDHSKDISLSEFLENNDWILSGTNNQ